MQIEFADDDLQNLYEDQNFHLPSLGPELVRAFRKKVGVIGAAADERDLRALKSLHLEKLKGGRDGQHSLRLNDQWRLIVRMEKREAAMVVVIIEIVDYH